MTGLAVDVTEREVTVSDQLAALAPGLVLVAGPPCAGKSTFVESQRRPGDLVLDLDLVAQAIGSDRSHGHAEHVWPLANVAVDAMARKAAGAGLGHRVWAVRSAPRVDQRRPLVQAGAKAVVIVTAPMEVCLARSQERNGGQADEAIRAWFERYEPVPGDLIVDGAQ